MRQLFVIFFLFIGIGSFAQTITAPTSLNIEANASNVDAGDFVVNWANNTDQLLISISLDYHNGATFSLPTNTGLTFNTGYTSWTSISNIVFYGIRNNINNALASMTISTGAMKTAIKISLEVSTYDASYKYNPTNKHFYKYVASAAITYANAKSGASGNSFKGKTGYLVTITSQAEQDFINNNITGNDLWFALTDNVTDGTWVIDAGPELGTVIKTQNGQLTGNIAGQYNNWCTGEPNGSAHSEDYAVTKWGGGTCWNDLPNSYSSVAGYIVEISADFPAGADYTGVYSAFVVHNNEIAYSLGTTAISTLSTSNISNLSNLFGGLQVNDGHTITVGTSTTVNTNKLYLSGTGKISFTDATSKWTPGTANINNTFIHSPKTNSNPTYWSTSSNYSGDVFYANAPYPTTTSGYHFTPWLNSPQGWSAGSNDANQYIILNYDVPAYISGIVAQGRTINGAQYVTNANIDVSLDGITWKRVKEGVNINTNVTDAVTILFPNVEYAKYVKLIPTASGWYGHITMKMGLIIKSNINIADGLVLHLDAGNQISYKGTGTSWTDLSDKSNNGTLLNSPTYNIYNKGYFTFNGSTSQVSIADNATLDPGTSDWTIEAWFYSTNTSGSTVVLGKFNNGGASSAVAYSIRTSGTSVYAQFGDGTGTYANATAATISVNNWYHVVFIWKAGASKTVETFMNGKSIGTITHTMSSILNSSNPLYLGVYNGNEFPQSFTGSIGIVRVYNKALTTQEVITNFNANRSRYGL
jgi:hypothetical protein